MSQPPPDMPEICVSWGELIDKITILEIKLGRLKKPEALKNVRRELAYLDARLAAFNIGTEQLARLKDQLSLVNSSLWDVENKIREKEAEQQFDDEFIALARSVYLLNDKRAAIKRQVNDLMNSAFVEEKSYER